jgi:hypothetical protein
MGKKVFYSEDCFVVPPRNDVIASGAKQSLGSSVTINIRDFTEGLYFIVADDGKERAVQKFVKE